MKKIAIFTLVFSLAACDVASEHRPQLAQPVKDPAKYEADRLACVDTAKARMDRAAAKHRGDKTIPAFGLIGYAVGSANAPKEDDYYRDITDLVDECLEKRGYKVVHR